MCIVLRTLEIYTLIKKIEIRHDNNGREKNTNKLSKKI